MTANLNPAQLVLAGVCAALLVVLGYLLFAPLPEISLPQVHARAESVDDDPPLPRFEPPPKAAFAEVDDRSVFNPARVRVVSSQSVAGTSSAATLPSDLSLVGVILDGEKKLALIKSPQEPLAVGIGVGGTIEGWQVTRVEPDRVALRAGGPEQQLLLSDNKLEASPPNGPNEPNGVRRPPFMRPGFQRPGMGPNGPGNPNGEGVNNMPQRQNQNNNNNNNNNNDDDDDN
ncbi:MAG TPA: hypothetical protein VKR31_08395 [Rhizomicrobium sp.]|nr:hypothetical protein [Rhizomicrobium sp.]